MIFLLFIGYIYQQTMFMARKAYFNDFDSIALRTENEVISYTVGQVREDDNTTLTATNPFLDFYSTLVDVNDQEIFSYTNIYGFINTIEHRAEPIAVVTNDELKNFSLLEYAEKNEENAIRLLVDSKNSKEFKIGTLHELPIYTRDAEIETKTFIVNGYIDSKELQPIANHYKIQEEGNKYFAIVFETNEERNAFLKEAQLAEEPINYQLQYPLKYKNALEEFMIEQELSVEYLNQLINVTNSIKGRMKINYYIQTVTYVLTILIGISILSLSELHKYRRYFSVKQLVGATKMRVLSDLLVPWIIICMSAFATMAVYFSVNKIYFKDISPATQNYFTFEIYQKIGCSLALIFLLLWLVLYLYVINKNIIRQGLEG